MTERDTRVNNTDCLSTLYFPDCGATYDVHEVRVACARCGDLLDVAYDWDRAEPPRKLVGF